MRFGKRGSLMRKIRLGLVHAEGDPDNPGGGGNGGEWTSTLPESVREWDEVKNSDSPEKFWDQVSNMRSRLGQSIRVPGKDAGEEDMKKFYNSLTEKVPGLIKAPNPESQEDMDLLYKTLGRPEAPDKYTVPEIKDANGNVIPKENLDMSLAEVFKDVAHKNGLSQKQYSQIVEAITNTNIEAHMQMDAARQADQAELQKEWGAAYDQNTGIVKNFVNKTSAPEAVVNAINSGVADRKTMKWFHQLATQTLGDGSSFQEDSTRNSGVMTPEEASLQISEIMNNKEHPYHRKNDPGHAAAMKRIRELYLLKNPVTGRQPAPGTMFGVGGPGKDGR